MDPERVDPARLRPFDEARVRLDVERFWPPFDDCLRAPAVERLLALDVERLLAPEVDRLLAPEVERLRALDEREPLDDELPDDDARLELLELELLLRRGVFSSCISTYALKRAMSARTARFT